MNCCFWMNSFNTVIILILLFCKTAYTDDDSDYEILNSNDCSFEGYEANCVLDILDEHIEARATINHCHLPLEITFRVIYRYGNGTDQRWQYTYVTTNQNERVLIPGLVLTTAPEAPVYLYLRVPEAFFDLHNISLAAVEASFIAVISEDVWEEAEFLNQAVFVDSTSDCFPTRERNSDSNLFFIFGGACIGVVVLCTTLLGFYWWHKRTKYATDRLGLVPSLENGMAGGIPYQLRTLEQQEETKPKDAFEDSKEKNESSSYKFKKILFFYSGFKFGRLKEENAQAAEASRVARSNEEVARNNEEVTIIANPSSVENNSIMNQERNANLSTFPKKVSVEENQHGVSGIDNTNKIKAKEEVTLRPEDLQSYLIDHKSNTWQSHPLEMSCDEGTAS